MSGYKKYFMFEAPGDEDDEAPTPKANTKVIKINPDDKRRTDYTQYVPDPDANDDVDSQTDEPVDNTTNTTADVPEDTPVDDTAGTEEPTVDEPDTTGDENLSEDTPQDETTPTETGDDSADGGTEPMIDETDYDAGETQDTPENTNVPDETEETDVQTDDTDYGTDTDADSGDTEPTTDDTDYTSDNDTGNGDTEADATDDTQNDADQQTGGLDDPNDKTHKFILFKKCISLESALSNYIQKLSGIMSDDLECNHTLGLFADYGRDILVTIDDLLEYQSKTIYTMQQLLDRRCSTNLFHFEYCPKCGEKINWKELRKDYK